MSNSRHFTLYLNADDRALLRRVGDALDAAGIDVSGPSGARSVAAVVRAALRIVDEQMRGAEGQAKAARRTRDRNA